MVVIERHPNGLRVYVCGQRIHHGASGLCVAGLCLLLKRRVGAVVALAVALHDYRDWRVWFRREVRALTDALDRELSIP